MSHQCRGTDHKFIFTTMGRSVAFIFAAHRLDSRRTTTVCADRMRTMSRHVLCVCRSNLVRKQRHLHSQVASRLFPLPTNTFSFIASPRDETSTSRSFSTNANVDAQDATNEQEQPHDHRLRSLYDSSTDWKDWFSATEYKSPWESSWLEPLDFAPADYATRHLIQLLQELFHAGRPLSDDRITTERCNHALQQLLKMNEIQGRAARADAILQTMELFDAYASSPSSTYAATKTTTAEKSSQHQQRLPLEIPKPNRETYNLVLQLYARTSGSRKVPNRCQELVEKMEWRYRELGELDMKPHAFHWVQVFLAWKECTDWDKAAHAAKIFLVKRTEGLVDVTSYITLLRICGHNHPNEKAAMLGANVAIKLWQVVMENDGDKSDNNAAMAGGPTVEDLPSHFYAHFFQAIRCLAPGSMRESYYQTCFAAACKYGKVNAIILNEFYVHVNSPEVFGKWLGPYKDHVRGKSAGQAADIMFSCIPPEWKARADGVKR